MKSTILILALALLTLPMLAQPVAGTITSPLVATATTGTPFSYQITVSGMGTTYAAHGLPAGLAYNASTGVISGTPNVSGTYTVLLNANQADGEFLSANLALTVNPGGPTNPPPPAKLFCANDPNPACGVYLTWAAGASSADTQAVVGYLVFRGISASSAAYTQLTPNPIIATTFTDTTMAPSTSYTYYIVSVDAAGTQSTPSNTFVAAIAAAPSVPTPPTPLNLTGSIIN